MNNYRITNNNNMCGNANPTLRKRNGLTEYYPAKGRGKTQEEKYKYTKYPRENTVPRSLQKYLRVKP